MDFIKFENASLIQDVERTYLNRNLLTAVKLYRDELRQLTASETYPSLMDCKRRVEQLRDENCWGKPLSTSCKGNRPEFRTIRKDRKAMVRLTKLAQRYGGTVCDLPLANMREQEIAAFKTHAMQVLNFTNSCMTTEDLRHLSATMRTMAHD